MNKQTHRTIFWSLFALNMLSCVLQFVFSEYALFFFICVVATLTALVLFGLRVKYV